MPTIPLYLNDTLFYEVQRYANLWEKTVGKTLQVIILKGLEKLEEEEREKWRKEATLRCTSTTSSSG